MATGTLFIGCHVEFSDIRPESLKDHRSGANPSHVFFIERSETPQINVNLPNVGGADDLTDHRRGQGTTNH
jgi:hypothetical protein